MLETQLTSKIVDALKRWLGPSIVIFKHNDRLTGGIPDLSVTHNSRTIWLEVKLWRGGDFEKTLDKLQLEMMRRLAGCGWAYYVVGYPDDRKNTRCVLVSPFQVTEWHPPEPIPEGTLTTDLEDIARALSS